MKDQPFYTSRCGLVRTYVGDALATLRKMPDVSVHCCVTSPPYFGLRDYNVDGQIGLEQTPAEFVAKLVEVFREVRRVLHPSGTCWVNMGSSYASGGNKSSEVSGELLKVGSVGAKSNNGSESFALRDNLTADEIAYVLSELAAHVREGDKVADPDVPVGVDAAIAGFARRKKV